MKRLTTRDIVLMALLSAALTAGKLALSGIPNVEIVTLLLIEYTLVLGVFRGAIISFVFTLTDCLIYGFNTWTVMYFLIWPLLVLLTAVLRPLLDRIRFGGSKGGKAVGQVVGYSVWSGFYGFAFGFLCAVVEAAFMGGSHGGYFKYLIAYWMSGLSFDVIHCVGNFCIATVLFLPLRELFTQLCRRAHIAVK